MNFNSILLFSNFSHSLRYSEYQCPSFKGQAKGEFCVGEIFRQWQKQARDWCSFKCEAAARLFDERQKALYGLDPIGKMCCDWEEATRETLKRDPITGEVVLKNKTTGIAELETLYEVGPCKLYGDAHIESDKEKLFELRKVQHVAVMCSRRGEILYTFTFYR